MNRRACRLGGWLVTVEDDGGVEITLEGWPPLEEELAEAKETGEPPPKGRRRQRIRCADEELDELRAVLAAVERLDHPEER